MFLVTISHSAFKMGIQVFMRKTTDFHHETGSFFYCFDRRSVAHSTEADHMVSKCTLYVVKSVGILMEVSKHFDVVTTILILSMHTKRVWQ